MAGVWPGDMDDADRQVLFTQFELRQNIDEDYKNLNGPDPDSDIEIEVRLDDVWMSDKGEWEYIRPYSRESAQAMSLTLPLPFFWVLACAVNWT